MKAFESGNRIPSIVKESSSGFAKSVTNTQTCHRLRWSPAVDLFLVGGVLFCTDVIGYGELN